MTSKLEYDVNFIWWLAKDMRPEFDHETMVGWCCDVGELTPSQIAQVKPWDRRPPLTFRSKYRHETQLLEELQ